MTERLSLSLSPALAGRFFTAVPPGKCPGCRHLNKTNDICKDFISKQGHIQRLWVDMTLKVKVLVAQLCLTLCDPMDYIVHGILWARILEWIDIPFSRGSSQPRD